jgi:hypothetical protein
LAHHATKANAWSDWRPEAMAVLRSHVDEARRRASSHPTQGEQRFFRIYHPAGAWVLVEVLLWEGDVDGAWEEAHGGGCPHRLWMRLAQAREADDPLAAVAIYRREVEQLVGLKTRRGYAQAGDVIGHIGDLYRRASRTEEFERYTHELLAAHKTALVGVSRMDTPR